MMDVQKYENYVAYNWWTDIDSRKINGWLQNFGSRSDIGKLILDNIIYYNEGQMQAYTLNIVDQLKAELYERNMWGSEGKYLEDDYFNNEWEKYKKTIKIIPADAESEAGGSPHLVARKYRSYLGKKTTAKVGSIHEEIENGVKEFIFVDDFSGTGNQLHNFLSSMIPIKEKKIPIGRLTEYFPDIKVSVAVYVIHKGALNRLKREFKALKLRYVHLIDENLNLLNHECVIYQDKKEEEVQEIISYLTDIRNTLINEQPAYQELAKYELHIPIVFEHGCPNNAFLPLYAKTTKWKQLFKRGDER